MTRTVFLTCAGIVALTVGTIAAVAPGFLLVVMKGAEAPPAALVMARTTGVLLIAAGLLALLVRRHPPSPTLRAILIANAALQFMLLPIDPSAWASGAFTTLGSFVPTLILHSALAAGFLICLWNTRPGVRRDGT
jgi:hypothetical protein